MILPRQWTQEELERDAKIAVDKFRDERLKEPIEQWKVALEDHQEQFRKFIGQYDIADLGRLTSQDVATIFRDGLGAALRYLAGPPISEDDLKVLADTSLAPKVLANDELAAKRVLETIGQAVDPTRFPWVAAKRQPTTHETAAAILASAVLLTAQRIATDRRSRGKDAQESAVQDFLISIGFNRIKTRPIPNIFAAPAPGEFCGETVVGERKADIAIGLRDGRIMPLECKVSNSATNSVKRLNNDAAQKAVRWVADLGSKNVVPAAVLSGVFNVLNLRQAQSNGLYLFWAHRLDDMREYIEKAV